MSAASIQAPSAVVMVRPHRFRPNAETASDNVFQRCEAVEAACDVSHAARAEVDNAVEQLSAAGIQVHLFEDRGERDPPDAVFPNNWLSTHTGGHVALFPMRAPSRRRERRSDVIEMLKAEYRVQDVIDYSGLEQDGLFLEGTGAMVLDHLARVAYVARSNRADPVALERFCTHFNFEPMAFDTADQHGRPVYHTNVLMCIATEFAMIGLAALTDGVRREEVRARLEQTGRKVIPLDWEQLANFAGNAIELTGTVGRVLALSERALHSLRPDQVRAIEASATLLPLAVPTIELAGGSVRCMIAGIHLAWRGGATPQPIHPEPTRHEVHLEEEQV